MLTRVAAAVAVAVALAGCGDEATSDDDVEAAVAGAIAERMGTSVAGVAVTCPDDVELGPGAHLTCELVAAPGAQPVALALRVDDEGTVELQDSAIPTTAAEAYLSAELAGPAEVDVAVDCGPAPLIVRAVGATFPCTVQRSSDGAEFTVTVEVTAVDGTVRYQVDPTTTSTTRVP